MSNISVSSFDEMGRSAQKLQASSEEYTRIYSNLMQVAGAMGTAWESADNLAFVEQIQGFSEELRAMAEKLSFASQALDQQKMNYVSKQDDNIAMVKKLVN